LLEKLPVYPIDPKRLVGGLAVNPNKNSKERRRRRRRREELYCFFLLLIILLLLLWGTRLALNKLVLVIYLIILLSS